MKTFEQLTKEQQINAIEFARLTIEDCLDIGIYTANREPSIKEILELAQIAAEESKYDEEGKIILGKEVDPFFLGGCI